MGHRHRIGRPEFQGITVGVGIVHHRTGQLTPCRGEIGGGEETGLGAVAGKIGIPPQGVADEVEMPGVTAAVLKRQQRGVTVGIGDHELHLGAAADAAGGGGLRQAAEGFRRRQPQSAVVRRQESIEGGSVAAGLGDHQMRRPVRRCRHQGHVYLEAIVPHAGKARQDEPTGGDVIDGDRLGRDRHQFGDPEQPMPAAPHPRQRRLVAGVPHLNGRNIQALMVGIEPGGIETRPTENRAKREAEQKRQYQLRSPHRADSSWKASGSLPGSSRRVAL